jgi:hypothetical protein
VLRMTTDLNDPLADLLGDSIAPGPRVLPTDAGLAHVRETVSEFTETCPSCRGTGKFRAWSGRVVGDCFKCKGQGKKTFKSSPEKRAENRAKSDQRKGKLAQEAHDTFATSYAQEWAWIQSSRATFGFAQAMHDAIAKYGDLTERQMETTRRLALASAAREEIKAAAKVNAAARHVAVDVTKLQTSFSHAHESGLSRIKMTVGGYTFSRAPDFGKNPGAIYVKFGNLYLGKIVAGVFQPSPACTDEHTAALIPIGADPFNACKTHGIETGNCSCCGRTLTDPVSVAAGIGPYCAERFGWGF